MNTLDQPINIIEIIDSFPFVELVHTGEVVIAGADDPDTIEHAVMYAKRHDDFNAAYDAFCSGYDW